MPSEAQNMQASEQSITKRRSFNNQKLTLPPLKWKGTGQLSATKRRMPQNGDANNTRALELNDRHEIKSILKSSIASCIVNSRSFANLKERRRVTFIDEVLNKPLAEFSDMIVRVKSKRSVCHCVIF